MSEPLADQVVRKIKQADELYHRLMLVVAPAGAGKTGTGTAITADMDASYNKSIGQTVIMTGDADKWLIK